MTDRRHVSAQCSVTSSRALYTRGTLTVQASTMAGDQDHNPSRLDLLPIDSLQVIPHMLWTGSITSDDFRYPLDIGAYDASKGGFPVRHPLRQGLNASRPTSYCAYLTRTGSPLL